MVLLVIFLLTLGSGAAAWSTTGESSGASDSSGGPGNTTRICHRTNAELNPYRSITPNNAARVAAHMEIHTGPVFEPGMKADGIRWGDIIPPFTFRGDQFPG